MSAFPGLARPAPIRIVAGPRQYPAAPRGALAGLAWTLAEYARRQGLAVVRIRCSRIRNSSTQHLVLRDATNRHWYIRISDHGSPAKTGHERPHFDLVTTDGGTGFELAVGFVGGIAVGTAAWWPPERSPKRKGQR